NFAYNFRPKKLASFAIGHGINNAFLNGDLSEEVYMHIPQGLPRQGGNLVCRLNKSLYGLRQASRQWFNKFSSTILKLGFKQSSADHSLFTKGQGANFLVLLVYVDDILVAGPNCTLIKDVQDMLQQHFKLKIFGDPKYFLGLEITKSEKGIYLCQRKYTLQLLLDTGFTSAKPAPVPMNPSVHFNDDDEELLQDVSQYRRLIGRLIYLTISRPDITYAVNRLSQFMAKPKTVHLQAVHHLLQYLKATADQGLLFPANSSDRLTAYVDADWGSCQKQATVAQSSAEAEYRALASVTTELLWMKQLLSDFGISVPSVKVLCDSKSAIQLAHDPTTHERTKHIDIDCHFLRQHVQSGFLNLIHVKSNQQLAGCLTKPLAKVQFRELMSKLGILNIYLPT
ncbi:putative copia-type protein, partial [Trifolium pratense]